MRNKSACKHDRMNMQNAWHNFHISLSHRTIHCKNNEIFHESATHSTTYTAKKEELCRFSSNIDCYSTHSIRINAILIHPYVHVRHHMAIIYDCYFRFWPRFLEAKYNLSLLSSQLPTKYAYHLKTARK